jgi:outer membrane protein
MKNFYSTILALGLLSGNAFADLVSIDSLKMLQESKEGQALQVRLQKDIESFQKEVQGAQQKVMELQEKIQKQAKVLSKEALMEKGEELSTMKKRAERDLADKEELLKNKVQREQMILREKQLKTAKRIFDEKKWGMMIDRNTPGVLFVNDAIDKTPEILKTIDIEYGKDAVKEIVNKTA